MIILADKEVKVKVTADISDAQSKLKNLTGEFSKIGDECKKSFGDKTKNMFDDISKGFDKLKDNGNLKSLIDVPKQLSEAWKEFEAGNYGKAFDKIKESAKSLSGALPDTVKGILAVITALKELESIGKKRFFSGLEDMKNTFAPVVNMVKGFVSGITNSFESITGADLSLNGFISTAVNYEDTMARVKGITGTTGAEFERLQNKARELGATTRYSATEAGEAMIQLGQQGWDSAQILASTEHVLNLATVGNISLADSAELVSNAMNALGIEVDAEGKNVQHFADVVAQASVSSGTNVAQFAEAMTQVGSTAGALGISIEDLATGIGLMGDKFIKSGQAGTSMKTFLANMSKPTAEMTKCLSQYNLEGARQEILNGNLVEGYKMMAKEMEGLSNEQKAQIATTLAGKEGMAGFLAIVGGGVEKIEEMEKAMKEADGVAEHMATTFDGTVKGALLSIKSGIEERILQVFDKIKPAVESATKTVVEFFRIWNGMSETNANLKGLGDALGYLEQQSKGWSKAISDGIVGAIKGLDNFINGGAFDSILNIGTNIIDGICDGIAKAKDNGTLDSAIDGAIKKICEWVKTNAPKIEEAGKTILSSIREGIANNRSEINGAMDEVVDVMNTYTRGKDDILEEWGATVGASWIRGAVKGIAIDGVASIGNGINKLVNTIGQLTADFFQAGVNLAKSLLDGFMNWFLGADTWSQCKKEVQDFIDWYKELDEKAPGGKVNSKADDAGMGKDNEKKAIKYADQTIDTYKKRIQERLNNEEITLAEKNLISKALDRGEDAKQNASDTTKAYINEIQGQLANGKIDESKFNSLLSGFKQIDRAMEGADETSKTYLETLQDGLASGTIDPSSIGSILSVLSESEQVDIKGNELAENYMNALRESLVTGQITPEEFRTLALSGDFMKDAKEYAKTNQINAGDVIDAQSFSNVQEVQELQTALSELQQQYADMSVQVTDSCKRMTDSTRDGLVGCANIVSNQATNMTNAFRDGMLSMTNITTNQMSNLHNAVRDNLVGCTNICRNQFVSMANIARSQMVNVSNIVRNQATAWYNIINNQCSNARDALCREFMSMAKVSSNQMKNVRTPVVENMMSIPKVVSTQAGKARDNLTRSFMSMASVVRTQMNKVLSIVQSTMASIASATSRKLTINVGVNKTVTTAYRTTGTPANLSMPMSAMTMAMSRNVEPMALARAGSSVGLGTVLGSAKASSNNKPISIEVPLNVDGKEMARVTAKYMDGELKIIEGRKSRKKGGA